MKILYTNFHVSYGGGHTTYVASLAESLRARHEIWVAAPPTSKLYLLCQSIPNVNVVDMPFPSKPREWRDIFSTRKRLRTMFEKECFDIVHVNGSPDHRLVMYALFGLHGKRPQVVYTKHNSLPVGKHFGSQLRVKYATDHVIAVSRHTSHLLNGTPYTKREVSVIPNGVDVEYFHPFDDAASQQARLRMVGPQHAGKFIVGSVAGTAEYKGWIDMVTAISKLPGATREKVHILIAGESPSASQRQQVAQLGMSEHVTFAENLLDVRPCIAALDIGFVLSYAEAISFACREMMAMGKPVIVTNCGGLPENITEGEDGWIVSQHDPHTLSRLLQEIIGNPETLRAIGESARRKSKIHFGKMLFVQKTEAVYQHLIATSSPQL
ncbi:glycosyltransferase [Mycoavidus sp. B2-EB]|uniref:glycosyltransferase n=1 Tax=Mycoavidus sp. B2-EB TaxID=2651972 RepID=UPI0016239D79|nr:glycosyltransferase [Mycoavidus sp. B2-EB]BBO60135.1 transferase [Mycoavidus sp. B2-EB]